MLRRILAGGLALTATGLVLATGPAVYADELKAPYARAGAVVDADGRLNLGKNIVATWRAATGKYCVQVAQDVDVTEAVIQITARHALRLPHIAFRNPSATCHRTNTVTVNVFNPHTARLADSGFDLSIS
ncbi:hypothetical protein ACIHFD_23110 [Nonomuraea sp. NPDC051941]|jgi:hypothetical protein|uniref:hypothetical protein n=1 Tax=Nonomuraea TaxID=83681 RepID=UPI00331DD16F